MPPVTSSHPGRHTLLSAVNPRGRNHAAGAATIIALD